MKPASSKAKSRAATIEAKKGLVAEFYSAPAEAVFKQATVAAVLGRSEAWCESTRCKGGGPKFKRLSPRSIVYQKSAVLNWLARFKECDSTRQYSK